MVQKSGVHKLRLAVYPIVCTVLYIQKVVIWDFWTINSIYSNHFQKWIFDPSPSSCHWTSELFLCFKLSIESSATPTIDFQSVNSLLVILGCINFCLIFRFRTNSHPAKKPLESSSSTFTLGWLSKPLWKNGATRKPTSPFKRMVAGQGLPGFLQCKIKQDILKMNLKWEPKNETTEKEGDPDLGKKIFFRFFSRYLPWN